MEPLVGEGVLRECPPMRGNADHHAEPFLPEAVDDLFALVEPVFPVVVEAHAPDSHKRPSVLVQVGRIGLVVKEVMGLRKRVDILQEDVRAIRGHAAEIVHDGDGAVELVRAFHRRVHHLVEMTLAGGIGDFRDETLEKHPVQPVLLHPAEVGFHRRIIVRRRHAGHRSVLEAERRLVQVRILVHLRPQVDGAPARFEAPALLVMVPVPAGPVAGGVEPPLIPRHDEPLIGLVGNRRPIRSLREGRDRNGQGQKRGEPSHFAKVWTTSRMVPSSLKYSLSTQMERRFP